MKKSLELILSKKVNKPKLVINIFSNFKDVKITDSSVIFLKDSLSNVFPGSGGQKGSSGIKIQLIYSYLSSVITSIDITKGNLPDQKYSIELLNLIKRGELFIADLGYMVFNLLYEIDIKQAYFLGRYKSSINLYEKVIIKLKGKDCVVFIPFKIEDNIKKFQNNITKKELYLKNKKRYLKVRMILFKNPEDTINNRRRILNKRAQKNNKSGKATNKSLILCNWSIFITNTDEEKLPHKMIHNIYRIRWNIELIFKAWKSILNIHKSNVNKNQNRVKMEIYAKLIFAIVIQKIYQKISPEFWKNKEELSLYKIMDLFIRNTSLIASKLSQSIYKFAKIMKTITQKAIRTCIKIHQKSRKTSLQMIDENITGYIYKPTYELK